MSSCITFLVILNKRSGQLKLNHVFKIYNQSCPSYLSSNFNRVTDTHNYFTRKSVGNFTVPKVQGVADKTFFCTAIKDWNQLPTDIQGIDDKLCFKKAVKALFIS